MDDSIKKGAVEGLINMVMYIYEAHLQEGQSVTDAKVSTLEIINDLGKRYAGEAGLEFKGYANPKTLLDQIITNVSMVRKNDHTLAPALSNLMILRSMLKEDK